MNSRQQTEHSNKAAVGDGSLLIVALGPDKATAGRSLLVFCDSNGWLQEIYALKCSSDSSGSCMACDVRVARDGFLAANELTIAERTDDRPGTIG